MLISRSTTIAALVVVALSAASAHADCGIVAAKGDFARTPDGRLVRLKAKANVVVFRPRAGHRAACWDEPKR
jgi:hypothetical protein